MLLECAAMSDTLGKLISRRQEQLGINNAELARMIDRSPQHLGELVNDKLLLYNPEASRSTLVVIKRLADALQVSILEILVVIKFLPENVLLDDPREMRMLDEFRSLPSDRQEDFLAQLSSIALKYGASKKRGHINHTDKDNTPTLGSSTATSKSKSRKSQNSKSLPRKTAGRHS